MFKEARFIFEEALPDGVSCSSEEREAMKAKYEGKSLEERQKVSKGVLDAKAGGGCSAYEKRLAQEEFFKSRKERRAAIDAEYGRRLLGDADKDGEIRREYVSALDALDQGSVPLVTGLFETLPAGEQALIRDLEALQKTANKAYWDANKEKNAPYKLSVKEIRKIQGVSAKDLRVESGEISDWRLENYSSLTKTLDDTFRSELWVSYGDFESVQPGYPSDRLYNRQLGITFIRERGADMSPNYRALGYINFAISLMHRGIKERDLVLAERCLDEAIKLMEPYLASDGYRNNEGEEYAWESVLEAAYVRKAAILAEKQPDKKKADPQVVELYKKAIKTDELGGTYQTYFNYLERFSELSLEAKIKIIDANKGEYGPTMAMRSVIGGYQQRMSESKNPQEYAKRLAQLKKLADRWLKEDGPSYYDHFGELAEWFGKDSTPAKRRELLGKHFDEDVREEMLTRMERSPTFFGKLYRDLVLSSEGQANMDIPRLHARNAFLWDLSTPAKVALFQARLLDDLSPEGMVDRKRAFDYYRKALADRYSLGSDQIKLAVTRCYRLINGPDVFSSDDYSVAGEVGSPLYIGPTTWPTIDNPDDLIVLYYDKHSKRGVAVNRYLNLPLSAYFAEDNYREKRKELRDLEKDGKGETEEAGALRAELTKLRKKLNPEAAGKIVWFYDGYSKDRRGDVAVDFDHPIYEFREDTGFPEGGFHAGSLGLDAQALMSPPTDDIKGQFLVDGSRNSTINFAEFMKRQNLPTKR